MTKPSNSITTGQLALFLIQAQIGVGILSLPFRVYTSAKSDGWISVLIAGVVTQAILLLMWLLLRRFPSLTIYGIGTRLAGKPLGMLLAFAYSIYFMYIGIIVLVNATDVIGRWMLQETPRWAILLLFAGTGIYLIRDSLSRIVRAYVLASFLIVPMIFLIGYGNTRVNVSYLLPFMESGWGNIMRAIKESTMSMYGLEMILIVYPFVQGKESGRLKAIVYANAFVVLFYTFTVLTCLMVFNPEQLALIPEPVIFLLRSLQLGIFDRGDIIFLPIWMTTVVASISAYFYAAATGIGHMLRHPDHRKATPWVVLLCTAAALLPQSQEDIDRYSKVGNTLTYPFILIVPIVLLLLSLLLRRKEEASG